MKKVWIGLIISCLAVILLSSTLLLIERLRQPAHPVVVPPEGSAQAMEASTPLSAHSRPDFATGVVFPQWGQQAYSSNDPNWSRGLGEIEQLHARWVAMVLPLHMSGQVTTIVEAQNDTPTPQALEAGIQQAHARGFKVFVYPLITLRGPQAWAGTVRFVQESQVSAWFASYWNVLRPYVEAMQAAHAEMFSIGNEYDGLESADPALWLQLIRQVRANFSGKVIYNRNWASFDKPLPSWISALDTLGVSTYWSVTPTPERLSQAQAVTLWKQNVQSHLDAIAREIGKPVIITEIGYLDVPTAGYLPYQSNHPGPEDDQEQAILYNAAMQNVSTDQHISGIFWWAWSLPPWLPNNYAASQALTRWFSAL